MLRRANKLLVEIVGGLIIISLLAGAFVGRLAYGPVSIDWAADSLVTLFKKNVPTSSLEIKGAALRLSPETGRLQISIETVNFHGEAGYNARIETVVIEPDLSALLVGGQITARSLVVDRIAISGEDSQQVEQRDQLFGLSELITLGAGDGGNAKSLEYLDLKLIELNQFGHVGGDPSHILWKRDKQSAQLSILLSYNQTAAPSLIRASGQLEVGQINEIAYSLDNIRLSDLAVFIPALRDLSRQTVPIKATGRVFVRDLSGFEGSNLALSLGAGELSAEDVDVSLNALTVKLSIDALDQSVVVTNGLFSLKGQEGTFAGLFDYSIDDTGRLSSVSGSLALPQFSFSVGSGDRKLMGGDADAEFTYYLGRQFIELHELRGKLAGIGVNGSATLDFSSENALEHKAMVNLNIGETSFDNVVSIWPTDVFPKTRQWVADNILAANVKDAQLRLDASRAMFEQLARGQRSGDDAISATVNFSDGRLRYAAALPALEAAHGRININGHHLEVDVSSAEIPLGLDGEGEVAQDRSPLRAHLTDGKFISPPFFTKNGVGDVSFRVVGPIDAILATLNSEPIKVMANIPFKPEQFSGDASAQVKLRLSMGKKLLRDSLKFSVRATSADAGLIASPDYSLRDGQIEVEADHSGMTFSGRGQINGVSLDVAGRSHAQDSEKLFSLDIGGAVLARDLQRLHLASLAEHFSEKVSVATTTEFYRDGTRHTHFHANLSESFIRPKYLSYEKAAGTVARVQGELSVSKENEIAGLNLHYEAGERDIIDFKLSTRDGELQSLNIPKFILGDLYDFSVASEQEGQALAIRVRGNSFDVARLIRGDSDPKPKKRSGDEQVAAPSSLRLTWPKAPKTFSLDGLVETVTGAHSVALGPVRLTALNVAGLIEKAIISASFVDGTELYGELFRDSEVSRRFLVQSEDASHIALGLDLVPAMKGGSLSITGVVHDQPIQTEAGQALIEGNVSMSSFQLQRVPVLAQLLSLASFTGLNDTLTGAGLRFSDATARFSYFDQRTDIVEGLARGPSLGISLRGAIDHEVSMVAIGGTLVPAYGLNSLFGKIPVLGPVLGGGKGEGVVGVSYRISGPSSALNVTVNPLSVLTPGLIRQIFQLGVGDISRAPDAREDAGAAKQ